MAYESGLKRRALLFFSMRSDGRVSMFTVLLALYALVIL